MPGFDSLYGFPFRRNSHTPEKNFIDIGRHSYSENNCVYSQLFDYVDDETQHKFTIVL